MICKHTVWNLFVQSGLPQTQKTATTIVEPSCFHKAREIREFICVASYYDVWCFSPNDRLPSCQTLPPSLLAIPPAPIIQFQVPLFPSVRGVLHFGLFAFAVFFGSFVPARNLHRQTQSWPREPLLYIITLRMGKQSIRVSCGKLFRREVHIVVPFFIAPPEREQPTSCEARNAD
jgi:hypothetical protein